VRESLEELRAMLARLGQPLIVRTGEAVEVLEAFRQRLPVDGLWSHEETGNAWTFARDRRVRAWAHAHGIAWYERRQTGVIRRLPTRDGWAERWDRRMRAPVVPVPPHLTPMPDIDPGRIPSAEELGLAADSCPGRQPGGRREAKATLRGFLAERGRPYQRAMSTPVEGALHCSRVSPHLAWGTLSMREALHAAERRLESLGGLPAAEARAWRGALRSFVGRLRWRCHFMQKLESEPGIEHRSLHPAYEGLRGASPITSPGSTGRSARCSPAPPA
jgi:deoxyribodipyrimidine photo-lyase